MAALPPQTSMMLIAPIFERANGVPSEPLFAPGEVLR